MDRPPEIAVGPEVHHRFRDGRDFGLGISTAGLMNQMDQSNCSRSGYLSVERRMSGLRLASFVDGSKTERDCSGKEVNTMQKLLVAAVLGASLAFTAGAAFADDQGGAPVFEPVQHLTVITDSGQSTVAGGYAPVSVVDTSRENGNNR